MIFSALSASISSMILTGKLKIPFEDAGIATKDIKTGMLYQKKTYQNSQAKYSDTESSANIRYNGESFNSSDNPTYNGE